MKIIQKGKFFQHFFDTLAVSPIRSRGVANILAIPVGSSKPKGGETNVV